MSAGSLRLILASGSPRRLELLSRLGLEPLVAPTNVDESVPEGESPARHVLRLARSKVRAAALAHPGDPVLAADTIVVAAGAVLGKPEDVRDALAMVSALRGRTHVVMTAVAVRHGAREATHLSAAQVTFAPAADGLTGWYATTGEGLDKAGAYAVQGRGAVLVERVAGNVQAVVGLPLAALPALFARVGLELRAEGTRLVLARRG